MTTAIQQVSLPEQLHNFNLSPSPLPEFVLNTATPKWPWSRHPLDTVVAQRRSELGQTKNAWILAKKQWTASNEAHDFQAKLRELQQTRQQYDSLLRKYEAGKRRREADARNLQLNAYLAMHHLNRANIPGIGAARRASLISFGIESAADISESAIRRVPGFGPSLTNELLQWRRGIEQKFVFDPHRGALLTDLAVLGHKHAARKTLLEQKLLAGSKELKHIRQAVVAQRQTTTVQLEAIAFRLAQAETDYSAAVSFKKKLALHHQRRSYALGAIGLVTMIVLAFTWFPRLGSMAALPDWGTSSDAGVASSNNSLASRPTPGKTPLPTFTATLLPKAISSVATSTSKEIGPTPTPSATQVLQQAPETPSVESITSIQPTPVIATIRVNSNLRSGPGTQYGVLRTASPGTKVVVIGASGNGFWYHLAGDEWISAELLDIASASRVSATATVKPAMQWAVVSVDTADVHSSPDSSSSRLATLQRGDCVQVNDMLPNWIQVRYQGSKVGWCARSNATLVDACPIPSQTQTNEIASYVNTPMRTNATLSRSFTVHECFGSGASELRNVAAGTPIEVLGVGAFRPPADQIEALGAGPYLKIRLWDGQFAWMAATGVVIDVTRLPKLSSICEEYDRID